MSAVKRFFDGYFAHYTAIPAQSVCLLPLIILDAFITSLCLNIALFLHKSGLTAQTVGHVIAAYYAGCLLGFFIGGIISARFSLVNLSRIGLLALSLCFYGLIHAHSGYLIELILFTIGLVEKVVSLSNMTCFIKTAQNDDGLQLRLINLEMVLFNVCFSLTAFILLKASPDEMIRVMQGLIILLLAFAGYTFYYHKPFPVQPAPPFRWQRLPKPQYLAAFCWFILSVGILGLIFSMIKVIYTPTIATRFNSEAVSTLVASMNPWFIVICQPYLSDRFRSFNRPLVMGVGGLLVGMSFLFFGLTSGLASTLFFLITMSVGEIMFSPLSKSSALTLFGQHQEGLAIGIWKTVFIGSGFFGPLIAGSLAENHGERSVWIACGLLGLLCFLFCLGLYQESRDIHFATNETR